MLKKLNITLNTIVFIIILYQLITLTFFSYKYNFHYDYGKKLKTVCTSENVEFETNRYQLNTNIKNIEIDNYNHYVILILSIIFTITISTILTFLFYNEFCNMNENFMSYNLKSKVYIVFMILVTLSIFIYPIILIIFKLLNFKFNNEISIYNHSINKNKIYIILSIICILAIFKLITIKYKYNLPDFVVKESIDQNKKYIELIYLIFYTFIYLGTIYYITNIIILFNYKIKKFTVDKNEFLDNKSLITQYIKRLLGLSEHDKYIEKIEYKKEINLDVNKKPISKNKNLPKNLDNFNTIPSEEITAINEQINKIFENKIQVDKDIITKLINKSIKDYIVIRKDNNIKESETELYRLIKDNENIKGNDNRNIISSIITQKISKSIEKLDIEIKNNNNIKDEKEVIKNKDDYELYVSNKTSIFRKNVEGLLFIIGIFLISIFIINLGIYYYNPKIGERIKNNIIIPLLSLYVLILVLITTESFNKTINTYIIDNPKFIYKNNINNANYNFNKILENEFYIYEKTNTVLCKNAKNSFISVINNVLFNVSLVTNINNNVIQNLQDDLKEYDDDCNNSEPDIDYNLTANFDNVFYPLNECSIINNVEISNLIKNTVLYDYNSTELKNLLKDIQFTQINKSIENTILYEIIHKNSKHEKIKIMIKKIKEKLNNLLKHTLYNTLILKKSYDNRIKTDKANINYLTTDNYTTYIKTENTNSEIKKYNYIINNIIDEYVNMIILNHYLLSKLTNKLSLNEIMTELEKGSITDYELKKDIIEYVNKFTELYQTYLNKLNLIFKNKYNLDKKTNKISLYLINIYNNINKENPYYDDIIYPYSKTENKIDHKSIIINFNKHLTNIINDYDKLRIICNDKIKYNNNECNIDITDYDKKILVKKIENICRTNNLNINKLTDIIDNNISNETNDYFRPYFKINDDLKERYTDLDSLLSAIETDLSNINNVYQNRTDGIIGKYFSDNNIKTKNDAEFENELNRLNNDIFNNFYKGENGNEAILNTPKDNLIKFRNDINMLLKISDKKIEKKIYEEKDNVLNLNKKISEVNYIFIYLIIIYIIIIFLIKYIK
jgi:hypothetical protein